MVAEAAGIKNDGFHLNEIDDALEVFLFAHRKVEGEKSRFKTIDHHPEASLEVSSCPVHLVDKGNPWNLIFVSLPPNCFGLGLYASHRTKDSNRPVQDTKGTFTLYREIDMSRGIDDIDPIILPETGGGGGGDGDPSLLFLFHPIHGCGALIHLANPVGHAGVIEDPLCSGRLSRIDVSHDADVTGLFF